MLSEPFKKAKPIIERIENYHHQAFFVGGCVRDLLLNRTIGDIDITTSARPDMIQSIFDKVIPVGMEHGTVIVLHENIPYEVTTFRVEGDYSDKRHPDSVTFINKIEKDLERRDFTINALAMDLSGNIIDLFEGKKDLHDGMIRTVGDGYERFKEDPLRIIRALRFSSQLGFQVHPETIDQMKTVQSDIQTLAVERLTNEFSKLFAGDYVNNGIKYLKLSGSYEHLPVFKDNPGFIQKLPTTIKPFESFGEVIALFHLLDPKISISYWIKSWKCSNQVKRDAVEIVKAYEYFKINGLDKWLVYKLNNKYYECFIKIVNTFQPDHLEIHNLTSIYDSLAIYSNKDLCINGNDLVSWFSNMNKGPWIRNTLEKIEKKVVLGTLINNKTEIKDWIKWNPPEID